MGWEVRGRTGWVVDCCNSVPFPAHHLLVTLFQPITDSLPSVHVQCVSSSSRRCCIASIAYTIVHPVLLLSLSDRFDLLPPLLSPVLGVSAAILVQ